MPAGTARTPIIPNRVTAGGGICLEIFWTKSVEEQGARDPLGVNRVSDRLVSELLHGITTVTPRARYLAFYTWAIDHVVREDECESWREFYDTIYELERVFLLATIAHKEATDGDGHEAIEGRMDGNRVWNSGNNQIDLSFRFLKSRGGGYTQDYRGSLHNLGLVRLPEGAPYDQPTDLGREVAQKFDTVASEADLVELSQRPEITRAPLSQAGDVLCLCRLAAPEAPDRSILRRVILEPPPNSLQDPRHGYRKETLLYLVVLSDQTSRLGLPLSTRTVRTASYLEAVRDGDDVYPIEIPPPLQDMANRWGVFGANDALTYCLEGILVLFLYHLASEGGASSLDPFLGLISGSDCMDSFEDIIGEGPLDPENLVLADLVDRISRAVVGESWAGQDPAVSEAFHDAVDLDHPLAEPRLIRSIETALEPSVPRVQDFSKAWLPLIVTLYMRNYRHEVTQPEHWRWVTTHTGEDLSIVRMVRDVHRHVIEESSTVADFSRAFIRKYVIHEAIRIASSKGSRLGARNPSWFHRDGELFVKDRNHEASHRNSRIASARFTLRDLGYVDIDGAGVVAPTKDGRDLLRTNGVEVRSP